MSQEGRRWISSERKYTGGRDIFSADTGHPGGFFSPSALPSHTAFTHVHKLYIIHAFSHTNKHRVHAQTHTHTHANTQVRWAGQTSVRVVASHHWRAGSLRVILIKSGKDRWGVTEWD